MSDFSRKDEPDQNMEVRSAGQTDEIEDGLEWIEETEEAPQTDGMPEKFRSEVEITEDSGADMSGLPEAVLRSRPGRRGERRRRLPPRRQTE